MYQDKKGVFRDMTPAVNRGNLLNRPQSMVKISFLPLPHLVPAGGNNLTVNTSTAVKG